MVTPPIQHSPKRRIAPRIRSPTSSSSNTFQQHQNSSSTWQQDMFSPTSAKRRVKKIERVTGPLSPMQGRSSFTPIHRHNSAKLATGSSSRHQNTLQGIARPPLSSTLPRAAPLTPDGRITVTPTRNNKNNDNNIHSSSSIDSINIHSRRRAQHHSPVRSNMPTYYHNNSTSSRGYRSSPPPSSTNRLIRAGSTDSNSSFGSLETGSYYSPGKQHHSGRLSPFQEGSRHLPHKHYYAGYSRGFMHRLMRLAPLLQLVMLFAVLVLVAQSHYQTIYTEAQLVRYRDDESALLLQLQRVERQSIKLHTNLRQRLEIAGLNDADESDSLGDQTSELQSMSDELHQQVRSLQETIQEEAKFQMINEFGEGPVKLMIEVALANEVGASKQNRNGNQMASRRTKARSTSSSSTSTLEVLLWPDTPHSVWALLEQVGRHVWDGAVFQFDSENSPTSLELTPTRPDPMDRGHLEFAEALPIRSPSVSVKKAHEAWAVGLKEDPETGRLQLFFNLVDNSSNLHHIHETCVGRVLTGYGSLQDVLISLTAPQVGGDTAASSQPARVQVRHVSAMHISRRELKLASKE